MISPLTVKEAVRYAALLRRTDVRTCTCLTTACRRVFRVHNDYATLDATELLGALVDIVYLLLFICVYMCVYVVFIVSI